ncbi:MAG: hypothetical protein EXS24_06730 [Pedosphaera sp.]|nr:hypothetical protein [Pedosphaera sp.]
MSLSPSPATKTAAERASAIRSQLPEGGLFSGHDWRMSPDPFPIGNDLADEFEKLGRLLLQFYRAANLLYRQSAAGKQPEWVARWLDLGKPRWLIELQRHAAWKNDLPRVIRPDVLLTENGFSLTELDSVPGGIGLTAWMNETYSGDLIGGKGMTEGFAEIFGSAAAVHIVVSEESATYRPEMEWLSRRLGSSRFQVRRPDFTDFADGDAVYRFFELFDTANVPCATRLFEMATEKRISLTPPPKPFFEEKMLFALLWNRNLRDFWRQELGESFFERLLRIVPCTWVMDPLPLPPHAAIPELNLTDWRQLKQFSQRQRDLIIKVSGFSELAWGGRGVHLGSDSSAEEWSVTVERALASFEQSPYVVQRFHKSRLVKHEWFDFAENQSRVMEGRARLCPYYFVSGEGDSARAKLGGVLATICPADKKIIHGMKDAILAPCVR